MNNEHLFTELKSNSGIDATMATLNLKLLRENEELKSQLQERNQDVARLEKTLDDANDATHLARAHTLESRVDEMQVRLKNLHARNLKLEKENVNYREEVVVLLDNAAYHTCPSTLAVLRRLQL